MGRLHLKNKRKTRFVDYFSSREQTKKKKKKKQLSLSRRAREVANDVSQPILVTPFMCNVTSLWSAVKRRPYCLPVHFIH